MDASDFVDVVDDDLLCTICHSVMVKPHTCSQGHQFCLACISTWLQQSPTCPSRCGPLAVGTLSKLRMAENLISKLQVRCLHAAVAGRGPSPGAKNKRQRLRGGAAGGVGACEWVGALSDRARHVTNECEYAEVECSWQGCDIKVVRFQLAEHEASCEQREVSCEKCEERVKVSAMSDHALGCKGVDIECPQECGTRVLRGELGEHEKECPNAVVSCSFAEHGCEVRAKRRKIREHEEEAVMAHSLLAARRAKREQQRNEKLQQELTEKMTFFQEIIAAKSEQVKLLEGELAERKRHGDALERQLAAEQRAREGHGEARVKWQISDFSVKAQEKERIKSNVFHVQTNAGEYRLCLCLDFSRKRGSTTQGYVGLAVAHCKEDGGCPNFPVSVHGTVLTVQNSERSATLRLPPDVLELQKDSSVGVRKFLSTDGLSELSWSGADHEEDDPRQFDHEPVHDVTEFLRHGFFVEDGDILEVSGTVRIEPAEAVSI